MTQATRYEQARQLLEAYTDEWATPEADRLDGKLTAGQLLDAVQALLDAQWGYLAAITGLDNGDMLELLYHFCTEDAVLTLRLSLDREQPAVNSICDLIGYASPFEREVSEMFGITFINTPDPSRLYLPDDWEAGVYPLLKDVQDGD